MFKNYGIMTYIIPIQSLCAADGEAAGNLLYNHFVEHPNSNAIVIPPIKVKTLCELKKVIKWIKSSIDNNNNVVISIDAHSCESNLTFKDARSLNKEDFVEYVEWEKIDELIEILYPKFQKNVVVIFVSCRSASFFASSKTSHVSVLASEEEVNAMRAKELLIVFYDKYSESNNIEQAYNEMIKKYPLEEEMQITSNFKSILKLYK